MMVNNDKYKIEIYNLNLIILLYLFRTAIPLFKYPFLLLYFGFLVYSLIKYRNRIISSLIDFARIYLLVLILYLILLLSFILSNKLYLIIFKDLASTLILLSLFFLLTLVITTKKEFNFFIQSLIKLIIFFALLISIIGIINLFSSRPGYEVFSLYKITGNAGSGSPHLDYNFALLPVFFGVVGILIYLNKSRSFIFKVVFSLLLVVFATNILLSGSRRGMIALTGIFIIIFVAQIISLFRKNNSSKKVNLNFTWFLLPLIILSCLFYAFIFHTSYGFKLKTLKFFNAKNIYLTKNRITRTVYSYQTLLNNNITYTNTYNTI